MRREPDVAIAVGITVGVLIATAIYGHIAGAWRDSIIQAWGSCVGVWMYWLFLRFSRSRTMTAPTPANGNPSA